MNQFEITLSFACFLGLFVIIGWIVARKSEKSEAVYITGGRSFGRYVIGLSAGAASASGFVMIGAVGAGYTQGLSAFIFPLGWLIGDLIFWSYFPYRINQTVRTFDSYTVPDLLSARVKDGKLVKLRTVAAFATVGFIMIFSAAQLLAAGKTVGTIFDVDLVIGIIISGVVIILYCFQGGLTASIWINFTQALMMIITTVGMLLLAFVHEGGSVIDIITRLNAIDPGFLRLDNIYSFGMLCAFIGFAFAGFGFDLSTPQFIVRLAASKSPKEASKSKWVYIGFMQLTWAAMIIFGMIIKLSFPNLLDPEVGLPTFAAAILPPWLVGIAMAGVFASIASTVDSQILVISNAITIDMAPALHKKLFAKFGMYVQYITTILVGVSLILLSSTLTSSVYSILQFAGSAIGGAFAPAMLIVILNWRTDSFSMIACMTTGSIFSILWELHGMNMIMLGTLPAMFISLCVHKILISFRHFPVKNKLRT